MGCCCRRVVQVCEKDVVKDEDTQQLARINTIDKVDLSSTVQLQVLVSMSSFVSSRLQAS
jgi:hypothetical protein